MMRNTSEIEFVIVGFRDHRLDGREIPCAFLMRQTGSHRVVAFQRPYISEFVGLPPLFGSTASRIAALLIKKAQEANLGPDHDLTAFAEEALSTDRSSFTVIDRAFTPAEDPASVACFIVELCQILESYIQAALDDLKNSVADPQLASEPLTPARQAWEQLPPGTKPRLDLLTFA